MADTGKKLELPGASEATPEHDGLETEIQTLITQRRGGAGLKEIGSLLRNVYQLCRKHHADDTTEEASTG